MTVLRRRAPSSAFACLGLLALHCSQPASNPAPVSAAPSNLAYATNPAVYTQGLPIPGNVPTSMGGTPTSWAISPPLPAGLSISTASGAISGTPTEVSATTTYTVTAANDGGSATVALLIAVDAPAPSGLAYGTNPAVYTVGVAIPSNAPTSTGGPVSSYSISPQPPPGLTFGSGTGVLAGTPAAVSLQQTYTVTASGPGGATTASLSITVNGEIPTSLTYAANPAVYTIGAPVQNAPSNGGGAITSYAVSPALPAGLALDVATGVISGTPSVLSPAADYQVTGTGGGGSTSVTLSIAVVAAPPSSLLYATNPLVCTIGKAIAPDKPSSLGGPVITYAVTPSLPDGLTLDPAAGTLSGTPTALAAEAEYTVSATDSGGSTTVVLAITVNDVPPFSLTYSTNPATFVVGTPITSDTPTSLGGTVVSYSVSPALPAGLALATMTGVVSGTPASPVSTTTYTVTAANSGGSTSASLIITVEGVPGAPVDVFASAGGGVVTVSWSAPSSTGGSPITSYTVTSNPGGLTVTTNGTLSATIAGLLTATPYTFTVTATNAVGISPSSSSSNSVTLTTVPGAPTGVTAVAGSGEATVSWNAPASDGGSIVTSYTVTASTGATATVSGALSIAVAGLTNGTSYTFTVVATNAVGMGPASTASNVVTPMAPPGAPSDVIAVAGDASATVTWTAPTDDGGGAVTGYTVTSSPGSITTTASAAVTSATVTGLTNGTTYTFTVTATNAAGTGAVSTESNAVTIGLPGAPTDVVASPVPSGATVTWSPAPDGGTAVSYYTVTANPGGQTAIGSSSATITGLTIGQSYVFSVTATNPVGVGPAATSNVLTVITVPQPPTGIIATSGDSEVSFTWLAPANDGGSQVTGYVIQGTGTDDSTVGTTTTGTSGSVTGLTNGLTYTFVVLATNAAGNSSPSSSVVEVPAAVPGVPGNVTATTGIGAVTVTWTAPASNGSAISGYTVTSSPGGVVVATTALSATFSSLTAGTNYTFIVYATNGVGAGLPSTESNAAAPIAACAFVQFDPYTSNFEMITCSDQQVCTVDVEQGSQGCAAPAYSASDGVVTDMTTGLLWQQVPSTVEYSHSDASAYCASLSLGGYATGWRMPSAAELFSLWEAWQPTYVDPTYFPSTGTGDYWTTNYVAQSGGWAINFGGGGTTAYYANIAYVQCVQ